GHDGQHDREETPVAHTRAGQTDIDPALYASTCAVGTPYTLTVNEAAHAGTVVVSPVARGLEAGDAAGAPAAVSGATVASASRLSSRRFSLPVPSSGSASSQWMFSRFGTHSFGNSDSHSPDHTFCGVTPGLV